MAALDGIKADVMNIAGDKNLTCISVLSCSEEGTDAVLFDGVPVVMMGREVGVRTMIGMEESTAGVTIWGGVVFRGGQVQRL